MAKDLVLACPGDPRGRGRRVRALELEERQVPVKEVVVPRAHPLGREGAPGKAAPAPLVGVPPVLGAVLEMAEDVLADEALPAPVAVLVPREADQLHAGPHDPGDGGRGEGQPQRVEGVERRVPALPEHEAPHPAQLSLGHEGHPLLLVEPVRPVAVRLAHEVHQQGGFPGAVDADDDRMLGGPVRGHQPHADDAAARAVVERLGVVKVPGERG